jgi:hypothetical protein
MYGKFKYNPTAEKTKVCTTKGTNAMKKSFIGLFALALLVSVPQLANAAFFDSSSSFLDATQWEQYSSWDTNNEITITDNDPLNRLEFSSSRTTFYGHNAVRPIASKWALDLGSDFDITINYHHSAINPVGVEGNSELQFNFADGAWDVASGQNPNYIFSVGAISSLTEGQDLAGRGMIMTPDGALATYWARAVVDGQFRAFYDASEDLLSLLDVSSGSGILVENLKSDYKLNSLKLALSAGSDGYPYDGDYAYFQNLQVKGAVVTPEPVSSVLFLVGGGAMAFARRRMKFNA